MIRIGDLYVVDSGTEFAVEVNWQEDDPPTYVECESLAEAELYSSSGAKIVRRRWYVTAWEDYEPA